MQLKIVDKSQTGSQSRYCLLVTPLQTNSNLGQLLRSQNTPPSELSSFAYAIKFGHGNWTGQNVANHLRKVWRQNHSLDQPALTKTLKELNVSTNHGTLSCKGGI